MSRPAVDIFLGTGAIQVVKPGALVGLLKKTPGTSIKFEASVGRHENRSPRKIWSYNINVYVCVYTYIHIYIVVDT